MKCFNDRFEVFVCFITIFTGLLQAAEQNAPAVNFQWLELNPAGKDRADAVGKAVDFQNWPQTDVFRVAPAISKSLLSKPELVTQESVSYSCVQFGQEMWGKSHWSWRRVVESNESLPTQLPEEQMRIPEKIRASLGNDPDRIDKFLRGRLERYQNARKKHVEGSISVEIVVAPNSRAANEYLLSRMTANTMPTGLMVKLYSKYKKVPGLGTINMGGNFVRDNIAVLIRADGQFSKDTLPLAQKIDSAIRQQPPLTYQQLLSRKPIVTVNPNIDATTYNEYQRTISYDVSVPLDQSIVTFDCRADSFQCIVNRESKKIVLPDREGALNIKLTAVTDELLANTFERDIILIK